MTNNIPKLLYEDQKKINTYSMLWWVVVWEQAGGLHGEKMWSIFY